MTVAYELQWTEYSREDYLSLDGAQRIVVDKGVARIRERGMATGQPLSGNLAGCNKIKHRKLDLRIVFRAVGDRIEVVELVVIGRRAVGGVCRSAERRLER